MDLSCVLKRLDELPATLESLRAYYDAEDPWLLKAEEIYPRARQALELYVVAVEDGGSKEIDLKDVCFIELLEQLKPLSSDLQNQFLEAVKKNNVEMVKFLLNYHDASGRLCVDPSANDNEAVIWASTKGYTEIVEMLLKTRDATGRLCVDPSAQFNSAINWASTGGHIAIVEMLLQARDDSGRLCVDPSRSDSYPLRVAVANGHVAVVERLLQDERVDPSARDNEAIREAYFRGYVAVVTRLLQDKRVDPSVLTPHYGG